MKKLAQSILRCKFPLYIRPSKRAFEKYKPQGFNIFIKYRNQILAPVVQKVDGAIYQDKSLSSG